MTVTWLLWIVLAFIAGALPFSLLIGHIFLGKDIRQYGDGNPGATNVLRASGSKAWFILAIALDMSKGLFPVGIAYWFGGYNDISIVPIAIAPIIGHAFSPFLGFNGGKAIAVTGGVWIGLTIMEAPIVQSILLTYWFLSIDSSDWAVLMAGISYLIYLLLTHPEPVFLAVWILNLLILIIKHRHGLTRLPGIKRWLPLIPRQQTPAEVL